MVIAGPTASGKSALAMEIAQAQGGTIVNADAMQIWSCWRVLTARPGRSDEAALPHALYGHIHPHSRYSVGDWLTDVSALPGRLIIAGGTGLYLSALTQGLAYVPPVPADIRSRGDEMLAADGLAAMIGQLDAQTRDSIDTLNPARVQRAWEVWTATGRGLRAWQADTPAPLISPQTAQCLVLEADRDWLAARIEQRFGQIWHGGAVDEVRMMLPEWNPGAQWARAIGAPEIAAFLQGQIDADTAITKAVIATRQYAKSQRIWFRNRMKHWLKVVV